MREQEAEKTLAEAKAAQAANDTPATRAAVVAAENVLKIVRAGPPKGKYSTAPKTRHKCPRAR